MKYFIVFIALLISIASIAQSPQSFKYQAVVRDNNGNVLVNKMVSIRTSILQSSTSGASVYTETQNIATNDFGVVAINIGQGNLISGNFATINWGADIYFIKTEVDLTGGSNYQFMGTTQLMSVPYALYAEKSGASKNDLDTSATNELQNLSISGQTLSISNGNSVTVPDNQQLTLSGNNLSISGGNTINLPPDNDADTTNEIQTLNFNSGTLSISKSNSVTIPDNDNQQLSINGQTLSISNGNNIIVPDNQTLTLNANNLSISGGNTIILPPDSDANPSNEIQAISLINDTLYLSNGGFVNMAAFKDNTDNQQLSISGNQLQISGGNTVTITGAVDLDADPINELQYLNKSGDTLYLSQGNFIVLPHDFDTDTTNEIQTLSVNNGTIAISNANQIHLPDSSNSNEIQTLSLNNDTLSISEANTVFINSLASFEFPQGLDGKIISYYGNPRTDTVPKGKSIYFLSNDNYGVRVQNEIYSSFPYNVVLPENTIYKWQNGIAVLINKSEKITPVYFPLGTYTVPAGKTLFIKSCLYFGGQNTTFKVNGMSTYYLTNKSTSHSSTKYIVFPENSVITADSNDGNTIVPTIYVTGYLKTN
jgi:hypothetical protein